MALVDQEQQDLRAGGDESAARARAKRTAEKDDSGTRGRDRHGPGRDADDDDKAKKKSSFSLDTLRRHPWITAAVIVAFVAILIGLLVWWLHARQFESTDDAFIDARTAQISAQVAGTVTELNVTDNQLVAAGAPLVRIDPRDYQVAVAQAKAQVEQADASVVNLDAQIGAQAAKVEQAKTEVTQAQAALKFSEEEQARYQELVTRGAGTVQRSQQANSDLTQKRAASDAAQANATAADRQLAVLRAQRKSAEAQVDLARATLQQADTNLQRTIIRAPDESRVTNLKTAKGAYVQPGQALMAVVPRNVWVTANFKETQLASIRVGQHVDITVDAYGGRTFSGRVDSIQAGSGPAFSLLPPENATGNYVKVVQRVPVKIVFDQPPGVYLGPGMSVVPSVKVR